MSYHGSRSYSLQLFCSFLQSSHIIKNSKIELDDLETVDRNNLNCALKKTNRNVAILRDSDPERSECDRTFAFDVEDRFFEP